MNARLVLITACILAVLIVLRAAIPDSAHAQQNEGGQSQAGAQNPATPLATPLPYFQLTWTAVADSFSDTTGNNGSGTVTRRHIVMAGTTVVRKLDDLPSPFGRQDNFPLELTVTDDYDSVETITGFCAGTGLYRQHHFWSIRDPGRYTPGPEQALYVDPFQLGDGTWYILDPFTNSNSNFGTFDHPFYYNNHIDIIDCSRGNSSLDFSGDQVSYIVPLDSPSADGISIQGDQDGNEFKISREFPAPIDPTPPTTVKWTFSARRLLDRDLTVDRLEATQTLQDKANSIPLVQGRRTVVRAFLGVGKDQVPISRVGGKLTGFSGSTELGSVSPFNPGGRITAKPMPDWLQIDDTLNFEVPLAWTMQPSLRFEVEVNDDHSIFETSYTNNKLSAGVKSVDCHNVNIAYVPVHYAPTGGFNPADPTANIAVGQEFMRKIFPIPDKGLNYFPWAGMTFTPNSLGPTGGDTQLLGEVKGRLLNSTSHPDAIFGWTPPLASPENGWAETPGQAAFGNDTESPNRWRRTFAHEIGHTYGLQHNTETTAGRHWFDVYELKIKPPNSGGELLDVMVPERLEPEAWISRSSYLYMIDQLCVAGSRPEEPELLSPTVIDNLVVSGTLNNSVIPAGTLDPLYRTTTAPASIPRAGAPYCVKLKNAADSVLNQYCFSVAFNGDTATPATNMPFGMVVPYPAGLNRVEITKGTTVLSSRVASANPPAVTVTFPNAPGLSLSGVQNVTWTGSDPDGGTLTYSLLVSRDNGATWMGVKSSITGNSYPLDFSSLPGGNSSLVKVVVSDGFRSAEDVSDNPFSVANKPPTAAIVSPPTGMSFPANTKVTLQADGADLEDGSLGDAAFTWVSNRDGALGSGQVLETNLSTGAHTITLTTRDSGALTSTATIICNAVSTASSATVSGRVLTSDGRGLRNATVLITDSNGLTRSSTTSSFGLYSFDNVATGQQYTVRVQSRIYRFASRTLTINDNVVNLDFVGLE